jgi:hypothetical protein
MSKKEAILEPIEPMEPIPSSSTLSPLHVPAEDPPKPKRASAPRKRTVKKKESLSSPVSSSLSSLSPPLPEQSSCIPTLYEEEMEEHTLSDYETEIVPLRVFVLNDITYYRDEKKNKLYRRIKEKTLGPYVGRYDPIAETLVTDVPDSDEE